MSSPGKDSAGLGPQHGHAPPFKRARSQDVCTLDAAAFAPMNSGTSESMHNPLINKLSGNIFFKTRLCEKYVGGGFCSNGEKCTFAHGSEDLHEPPPNWKEVFYAKSRRGGTNRGMKLCKNAISEQECPYGEKCKFLHRVPGNNEVASSLPINISSPSTQTTGTMLSQTRLDKQFTSSDASVVNRKPASFKTKMCTKWEITGQCPLKERCHFAHGHSELQVPGSETKAETLPTKAEATQKRVTDEVLPKWKIPKKITTIYADWPEGFIPPEKLLR